MRRVIAAVVALLMVPTGTAAQVMSVESDDSVVGTWVIVTIAAEAARDLARAWRPDRNVNERIVCTIYSTHFRADTVEFRIIAAIADHDARTWPGQAQPQLCRRPIPEVAVLHTHPYSYCTNYRVARSCGPPVPPEYCGPSQKDREFIRLRRDLLSLVQCGPNNIVAFFNFTSGLVLVARIPDAVPP